MMMTPALERRRMDIGGPRPAVWSRPRRWLYRLMGAKLLWRALGGAALAIVGGGVLYTLIVRPSSWIELSRTQVIVTDAAIMLTADYDLARGCPRLRVLMPLSIVRLHDRGQSERVAFVSQPHRDLGSGVVGPGQVTIDVPIGTPLGAGQYEMSFGFSCLHEDGGTVRAAQVQLFVAQFTAPEPTFGPR